MKSHLIQVYDSYEAGDAHSSASTLKINGIHDKFMNAIEMQDEKPWQEENTVECILVQPVQVTVTQYQFI